MTATCKDDGWLRTHDDMRAAVQGEAERLGARARCHRSRSNSSERHVERQGSYVLTLERFGQRPLTIGSAYSLPALEDKIIGHVRSVVEQAARAAEGHMR